MGATGTGNTRGSNDFANALEQASRLSRWLRIQLVRLLRRIEMVERVERVLDDRLETNKYGAV
jgi:hypothetical protein